MIESISHKRFGNRAAEAPPRQAVFAATLRPPSAYNAASLRLAAEQLPGSGETGGVLSIYFNSRKHADSRCAPGARRFEGAGSMDLLHVSCSC
jgi:hypothetical protein